MIWAIISTVIFYWNAKLDTNDITVCYKSDVHFIYFYVYIVEYFLTGSLWQLQIDNTLLNSLQICVTHLWIEEQG